MTKRLLLFAAAACVLALAQTDPGSVQPMLDAGLLTPDVVSYQIRNYYIQKAPALPKTAGAPEWTAAAKQIREKFLREVVFHGWPAACFRLGAGLARGWNTGFSAPVRAAIAPWMLHWAYWLVMRGSTSRSFGSTGRVFSPSICRVRAACKTASSSPLARTPTSRSSAARSSN